MKSALISINIGLIKVKTTVVANLCVTKLTEDKNESSVKYITRISADEHQKMSKQMAKWNTGSEV